MPNVMQLIFTAYIHLALASPKCIHGLAAGARHLASVTQLVRAVHRNRRTAGSIPARGPIVALIFAVAPG